MFEEAIAYDLNLDDAVFSLLGTSISRTVEEIFRRTVEETSRSGKNNGDEVWAGGVLVLILVAAVVFAKIYGARCMSLSFFMCNSSVRVNVNKEEDILFVTPRGTYL